MALLQGCVGHRDEAPEADPAKVRAQLLRLLPAQTKDREGWARDIQVAFETQRITPSKSNLCAVLAVTEQESTFSADPQVPNLGRIAREEIDRRAARLHIPRLLVDGALKTPSGNGQSYQQRLQAVRSEKQLSALYDEVIARVPLGKTLLGGKLGLRICGLRSPSFPPSLRAASSVAPGMIAPGAIRSPSKASVTPVALFSAAWNAALRLAYQPALKSAKRYSWRS